ncbi:MAG: ABC transporter permease, partial [Candidatus Acidiferrales bacterium]
AGSGHRSPGAARSNAPCDGSIERGSFVSSARTLRKIAAFFWRDFSIARGYRTALVFELVEALFGVATFYYLSRFVESPQLERALPAGSNYFAFALVGFAFFDYMSVAFSAFDDSIAEARQNRTLEALLVTQTPLRVILAGSAVYPFLALALRTCVYLGWGALFFHFIPREANWPGALAVLLASILAFSGLGILSAAYQILFKRGNPAKWLLLGVSGLVGGMMYPVSVLPGPLQMVARLIPVTYSLEGMRAALLAGAPWKQLLPSIAALLIFAAVLIPLSFVVFAWALRRTKITGTLTHI